jgi:hypothetical protein
MYTYVPMAKERKFLDQFFIRHQFISTGRNKRSTLSNVKAGLNVPEC